MSSDRRFLEETAALYYHRHRRGVISPWLVGMGVIPNPLGLGYTCRHGRQLSICAICAPEADERYAQHVAVESPTVGQQGEGIA